MRQIVNMALRNARRYHMDVLGLDLGTSSVKLVLLRDGRVAERGSERYAENAPRAWLEAIRRAAREMDLSRVGAIGLSAQVGTYIVNGERVIPWNSPAGADELERLLRRYPRERFMAELSMPHPRLASYPLPRLMYCLEAGMAPDSVCQPKDYLCRWLTGRLLSDRYSWRELAGQFGNEYSGFFLGELGLDAKVLPELAEVTACAGPVLPARAEELGLPGDAKVYVGMNDFFCALLGMGAVHPGDMFDITGTSEHLGVISAGVARDAELVSSPFLENAVHYGVTASSGASMDICLSRFDCAGVEPDSIPALLDERPPIFLPYVNGERAPVFDPNARGVFFGVSGGCSSRAFAYSVMEGIVFSLLEIYELLGRPRGRRLLTSGGASRQPVLNRLKADLLGLPVYTTGETGASALGAAIAAAAGSSEHPDLVREAERVCGAAAAAEPAPHDPRLDARFGIFKSLYPALREHFKEFMEVQQI